MNLYTLKEVEIVNEKIDKVVDEIEEEKLKIFEPTKKEMMDMAQVVLNYIKVNKRKIYGGYAQNQIIKNKNVDDAFYKDDALIDIDFYSPEPITDIVNLAKEFHEKGFKYIEGKDAQHKETYKLYVNFHNVCDISYSPRNVFYKVPFVEINGVQFCSAGFMMIDLFKIISDPYFSLFRWKKVFPRIYLLQKNFPFNKASRQIGKFNSIANINTGSTGKALRFVFDYIKGNNNFIIVGQYAYNHFLKESDIIDKGSIFGFVGVRYYEIVTIDYLNDTVEMITDMKRFMGEDASKVTYEEYYPLWTMLGYNTVMYFDGVPIANIIHYGKRCSPIKIVKAIYFDDGKIKDEEGTVQIGNFDFTFLMTLVMAFRMRVLDDGERVNYYNIMLSHLVEIRHYYFQHSGKNLLDDTLFQSFIINCIGETIDPIRETRLFRIKKAQEGKLVVFSYRPETPRSLPNYKFANTSGNLVDKKKNLKVVPDSGTDSNLELDSNNVDKTEKLPKKSKTKKS